MNRQIAAWITHRWAKWVALIAMIAICGGLGSLAPKLTSVQDNKVENWLPGSAESTKLIKQSGKFYDSETMPGVVIYERNGGILPTDIEAVKADMTRLAAVSGIRPGIAGPIVSKDGAAIETIYTLRVDPIDGWNALPGTFDDIRAASHSAHGLTVQFAGPAAYSEAQAETFSGIDGKLLIVAMAGVVIMLLLAYRSPSLVLTFLIGAGLSLSACMGLVYLLARHANLTVNAQSQGILSVLVLGASVDYALLLVARYREELRNFEDRHEAMAHALHRAAPAILASGLTVALGMSCLTIAEMNSTAGLGPVLAVGVLCALLVMLILMPALLVILGRWNFWPFIPHFGSADHQATGLWARVGNRIATAPRLTWLVTAVILGALSLGVVQLNAHGLTLDEQFVGKPAVVDATKTVGRHFPAGDGAPIQVLANADKLAEVTSALAGVAGIAPDTVKVTGQSGDQVFVEATQTSAPASAAAIDTVDRARAVLHTIDGAHAIVGGQDAVLDDTAKASAADTRAIIPIVLVVIFVVLMVLLRALVAPALLLATVILSFSAALGVSAVVFRHVFGFAGVDPAMPLFVFVFLVALGVDYNIFLMTRVREEALDHGTRRATRIGLAATGSVITLAGLILAFTFGALGTLPAVFTAELGFAVALGVLLDTFIVRSVLVTALNLDIGRHIWWPSKLAQKADESDQSPELVGLRAR